MKMYLGDTPIKLMNIKHYELDTNDATMVASDLQSGVTCYAKGKKVIGTGKSFEFAHYGGFETNSMNYIPSIINVIEIASVDYPIKSLVDLNSMKNGSFDFSIEQPIGMVVIDNTEYPITLNIDGSILKLNCEKIITLQVFLGKDNYV